MGEQLANQCKTMFCELSAKTGDLLSNCIQRLGRSVPFLLHVRDSSDVDYGDRKYCNVNLETHTTHACFSFDL